jgi:hypothetical protein
LQGQARLVRAWVPRMRGSYPHPYRRREDGTRALGRPRRRRRGPEADIHVHVGCTFGNIAGNVALDSDGRFTVNGSYVLRAYPVQTGPSLPAQFSGRISGSTMTLAIAVNDTVENRVVALGPIVVVFDREPEMAQCPICRVPGLRP